METTNIYVLIDPRDEKVRYVGKANDVSQRYRAHLNRTRKHQIHKANWIKQLRGEGLKPRIEVIDVVPITEWVFWETFWIAQMKAWGFDLINYTLGGDGCTFGNQTSFKKGDGGKKVVGYNDKCEKVYAFDSMRQAETHIKSRSMWGVLIGKRKTCKGLAWFYVDEIKSLDNNELNVLIKSKFIKKIMTANSSSYKKGQKGIRSKKVMMYDLNWNFIRSFESAKEAGEFIGVTGGAIQFACLNSKQNKCKNNKFKYE